jgi:HK97 family phage major capsid protein
MATSKDLREQRASIWEKMQETYGSGDMSAEAEQKYDRLEAEYDALDVKIERAERQEARAAANGKVDRKGVVAPSDELDDDGEEFEKGYTSAFNRWLRAGINSLGHEDQKILQSGFVKDDAIRNAQGVGTGAAGGYAVPPAFRQKVVEKLAFMANMRQYAEVITTETGADLPWPTEDDTTEGAILGENTQASEEDFALGTNNIGAYMYHSKVVRASLQIVQDGFFDLDDWLSTRLARRIARVQNRHFTVGTGTSQPDGLITSAAVGVTAASTTLVTYDELVDLTESIDAAYLEGSDPRFMFNQKFRKGLRKLKDGNQRPLWEPSMTAGTPALLMGYPTALNNYVPEPAANAKTVAFGDIKEAYLIRDVSDFALLRLTERYAEFLQVGYLGFQRSDGTLQNSNAVRTLRQAAA